MTAKNDRANASIEKAILRCNLPALRIFSRRRVLRVFEELAKKKGGIKKVTLDVRNFIGVEFRAYQF
ncbi:hypothetical protein K9N08_03225 [Candidatus Gracilibacteria bacterium]|nr:hypothetical protein [Candidatus Gracilibacteria bacterium]MCF7856542.1 hypothetical protein [Candidatus Gracilibacteria bacterium]MCF7896865.1 hypothetical protein [Candidatus Gracilibacteria bacterium]